jgi:hypothetical protein
MILTRSNFIDGKENSMELPLTEEEFAAKELIRENTGALIQNVYPNLTADQREFIKTGITPELWNKMFGNE